LACGNWEGPHRFWVPAEGGGFTDHATAAFSLPSPVRTVIAADFDNDGREEIFFNNIGAANRLFRVDGDEVLETDIGAAAEVDGLGTGAAVIDIDGDGVLELLVAHGESAPAPLTLYSVPSARGNHWLRVRPVTAAGAPARGAVVTVERGERRWRRLVDSGSGYLCQMEPVAHVGLGPDIGPVDRVTVRWPGGRTRTLEHVEVDQEIRVHPSGGG
jgi:ASPIC/UnbV protein/VCBS repeat protein